MKQIAGLQVITKWNQLLTDEMLANPEYAAVNQYGYWKNYEPIQGEIDYDALVTELTRYKVACKTIGLNICAGCKSPDWIYDLGVPYRDFTQFQGNGNGTFVTQRMPQVWHNIYKQAYISFLTKIANHLKTYYFDIWRDITHVYINGVTTSTAEYRLPYQVNATQPGSSDVTTDAIALWNELGYTQDKVHNALVYFTNNIARIFPQRRLIFGILPTYFSAFPDIGTTNLNDRALDFLKLNHLDKAVVNFTSLTPTFMGQGVYAQVKALGLDTSFQLNEGMFGDNQQSPAVFAATLNKGISLGALTVQLHSANVIYDPYLPAMHDVNLNI